MSTALYNDHFGFHERPFSLSPDPDFLFWSKAHARALSVLEYGLVTRAPLTVVSGEVGTGKTTLIQELLRSIEDGVTVGLLSNARGDRGDLLRWVLSAFDVAAPEGADYVALFQRFQDFVLGEYAAGRHVALIVDEAQNLGADTLEELRMLTNINSGKDELLQIILV
ncbi:MAG: ExeA family protein, partial [Rhodovulum sp.]